MRTIRPALLLFLLIAAGSVPHGQLRVQPVAEHPGELSLRLMLRKLQSTGTFMQTTAHPDDEDNALLATLGLGQGMRTVLVTATRGEGGQNEIGPELFLSLGVLRTAELLAAHRFDGAEQYFTRAIDFGYSFSVEETLEKWGHDEILGDFVRHFRTVRPDVIAGFICGGEGGGQHHQASARLTIEAFRAAADPARYPDQIAGGLRPWQARRVFCTDFSGFGPRAAETPQDAGVLTVAPGGFDPLLGRTFTELGIEARSMHKCQGTSQLLPRPGATMARNYRLRDTVIGSPDVAPKSLFDGINTSLAGLARFAGKEPPEPLVAALGVIAAHVDAAATAVASGGPGAAGAPVAAGLAAVRDLRGRLGSFGLGEPARYEIDFRLEQKERQFEQALVLTHALRLDVLADDGLLAAGQPVKVSLLGSHSGPGPVVVKAVRFAGLEGPSAACATNLAPGTALKCDADLRVSNAALSSPYWTPLAGAARYRFEPGVPFGVPFAPSPFRATIELTIAGADVGIERTVEYRYDHIMAGEKRMDVKVVPPFAVTIGPEIAVIPASAVAASTSAGRSPQGSTASSRDLAVRVINHHQGPASASVSLQAPAGWSATPASLPVRFSREDEEVTVRFTLTPPAAARPGEYGVKAMVTGEGATSSVGYDVIEYHHIQRRHVTGPAEARVKIVDVTIAPNLSVGYVMGVGDQVPQAIEQLGAELRLIEPEELAAGDLSRYDVIVTGVRAYERRPDLRANNQRLLDYARQGGTVLVQYNKFEFNEAQYGPFPAEVGSGRVTDENAPVELLVPDHTVFTAPNRIGPEAWHDWVQERGLYFLGARDPRYADLVRLADPFPNNPGEKTGALVEARVGKGRWIYIGLGLWRQLPAGTEGAYRLMANLLSLGAR